MGRSGYSDDLAADLLPADRVTCLRQVLQHLSNDQIARIIPKLRARHGSAVVCTAPSFGLPVLEERPIFVVEEGPDRIRTVAYRLLE